MTQNSSIIWPLNRWLWEEAGLQEDYATSPFRPVRSSPETRPSIVYTERITGNPVNYWEETSEISYYIFETDYDKLTRIKNKIVTKMKSVFTQGQAAREFTHWLSVPRADWPNGRSYYEEFKVHSMDFRVAPDITPPGQQGEAYMQMVRATITYTRR